MAEPDRLVIRVHGDLDLATVPQLRRVLDEAIGVAGKDVCVDFTEAPFFDTLTVGSLAATARRLRTRRRHLSVLGLSRSQEALVRLCGLKNLVGS